jgi:uncharacterized protein DUF6950
MRREDWPGRLWATLKAADGRPFQYGACVQLAAECVDAITVRSNFRQEVVPLIEAAQVRPIELAELWAHVTERLGEPIPINWANQGDVVLLELPSFPGTGNGPALGICTGPLVACAGYPSGVAYLNLNKAKAIWRVA